MRRNETLRRSKNSQSQMMINNQTQTTTLSAIVMTTLLFLVPFVSGSNNNADVKVANALSQIMNSLPSVFVALSQLYYAYLLYKRTYLSDPWKMLYFSMTTLLGLCVPPLAICYIHLFSFFSLVCYCHYRFGHPQHDINISTFAKVAVAQDDEVPIVRGDASGPDAQTVNQGSSHTAISQERGVSTNSYARPSNDRSFMNDVVITQPSYLDQFIYLPPFTLDSSTVSTAFDSWDIPLDLLTEESSHNPALTIFNSSAFVSWDELEVVATVSSPPQVSGFAILCVIPGMMVPAPIGGAANQLSSSRTANSRFRGLNMPHAKLSYTESNPMTFSFPWNYPFSSVSTTNNFQVPTVACRVQVINIASPAAGVGQDTRVTITLALRFKNLRGEGKRPLNVPMTTVPNYAKRTARAQDNECSVSLTVRENAAYSTILNSGISPTFTYTSHGPAERRCWSCVAKFGTKIVQSEVCASKKLAKTFCIRKLVEPLNLGPAIAQDAEIELDWDYYDLAQAQDLTSILNTVGSVANSVSNVAGTVASMSNPVGLASAAGSLVTKGLSSLLNFKADAPWKTPGVDSKLMPLNHDHLAGGTGPRAVTIMDINDSEYETMAEGMAYNGDEGYNALFREGFVDSITIPTNTQPGIIAHLLCTVIDGHYPLAPSAANAEFFWPTPAGYVASCYTYVSGAKEYVFYVVKAAQQRVTLNFAFNPTFPPRVFDRALAGRSETVTFQEDVTKVIEAPIIVPTRVHEHNPPNYVSQYFSTPVEGFGYLTISLVNPIVTNSLCSDSIRLYVFSRMKKGSMFFSPRVSPLVVAATDSVFSANPIPEEGSRVVEVAESQDDEVDVNVEKAPMVGTTAAAAAVTTMEQPARLDGFGPMPKPLDVARRAVRIYSIRGSTPANIDTQRALIFSVNYLFNKTLEPGTTNYQPRRPAMFDVLSTSNALAFGSLDYVFDLEFEDATVKNVRAFYVNSIPKYLTRSTAEVPYAFENGNVPMLQIVDLSPASAQRASAQDLLDDLIGGRALEIRQIGLNSQIVLGLPCHTKFSAMSTIPVAGTQGDPFKRVFVPPTVNGYVVIILPSSLAASQSRNYFLNVYRRAADTCHFSVPIGPPQARWHKGSGSGYAPTYALNYNELPASVDGTVADLNLGLQYHSRLFGGITGLSEYPLNVPDTKSQSKKVEHLPLVAGGVDEPDKVESQGATNRDLLSLAGDVESNPGPVQSKLGFSLSNQMNALKRTIGSAGSAALALPNLINNLEHASQSLPETQRKVENTLEDLSAAAGDVAETSSAIRSLTSTFDDMIKLVYDKLLAFSNIPFTQYLQIAHYISIMMMSNERAVSISCFVGIVANLGLINSSSIMSLMTKISSFFTSAESQDDGDMAAMKGVRYFNIIFSVILSAVGIAFTPVSKLPTQLLNISSSLFRNLNQVDIFLKHNFDLISDGLCWITATKYKAELVGVNLGELKPRIETWLTESVSLLDPHINQALRSDRKMQKRFVACHKEGADIYSLICKMKLEAPNSKDIQSAYNLIDRQFKRLSDRYVEYAGTMLLSDKYSVPFCIWLYGLPGVGKTHMVPYLALQIAKSLNLTSNGDILYRRETGQDYWDALAAQPFLWMSDPEQDNSEAGITQFIKDWFSILSPTEFVPNMAALQDKGRKHKFTGVFVDSNSFYSNKRQLILSDDAFKSRRDVVAHVILNPAFVQHCEQRNIPAGRNLINSYLQHCKANPCNVWPGFEKNDHLLVSFSLDGTETPHRDIQAHVPFSRFVEEVVPHITNLVRQRRIVSAEKEKLFDELSPENTILRLKNLDAEKRKDALDLLTNLLGETDDVVTVRNGLEELPVPGEDLETDVETALTNAMEEPAIAQDDTSDTGSVSNFRDFLSAAEVDEDEDVEDLPPPPEMPLPAPFNCVHEFVISCKYPLIINGLTLIVNWPRQLLDDDNREDVFIKNMPELGDQLTRVVVPPCNCSWLTRNNAFAQIKESFVPEDQNELKLALGISNPLTINVTPSSVLMNILKVLGMVTLGYAAVKLIGWIVRKFMKSEAQDYERTLKVPTTVKSTGFKLSRPAFSQDAEAALASGCGQINFYFKAESGLRAKTTNAYAIGGTAWFVAGHTIRTLQDLDVQSVEFKYKTAAGTPVTQVKPWNECKTTYCVNDEYDYGVIDHPHLAPVRRKDGFFATAKECKNASSDLAIIDYNNGLTKMVTVKFQKICRVQVQDSDGLIRELEVFTYHGFEGAAKCGSPLVDLRNGKIVGFHVLGWPGKAGGATPITLENMKDLVQAVKPTFVDSHQVETKAVDHALGNESCIVEEIVDASMVGRVTVKSKLVKSAVHGALGAPEKVIPTGSAQDAIIAMEPYSTPPKTLVVSDIQEATQDYLSLILEKAPPVSATPPTVQPLLQVLKGNPQLPFHPPPMRDTSSGVPLIHQGLPRKGDCFTMIIAPDGTKTITSLHPKFKALYNSTVEDIMDGIYPKNGHMLFLKDERKKPAKAIRGINGCDFVMYCLYLQYFQPFFAAFRKARFAVGSAIGMDISRESAQMFSYMCEVEEDVQATDAQYITADYKNFGPTIIHHVASQILVIIKAWYKKYGDLNEEQFLFMERLFACLLQSNHIVLNLFVRPQQGIFSGNPFTAEINTMVNNLYLRLAWLYCIKDADLVLRASPWYWFRKYVRLVCYGDDLVARTHRCLYNIFNNVTIKAFMDVLGLTFTDALKRAEMVKLDPFPKVSFLKHSFSLHPHR